MTTIDENTRTTHVANSSTVGRNQVRVFLTRGLVAVVWAAVFASASHSLASAVTLGAGVLLVLYPLIDVVGSLQDARDQHGSARRLLVGNAAASAVAALALGLAAFGSVADVLAVFGVWALMSGAAQLTVALRRRAQFGNQWPMLLAGGGSVIAGLAYLIAATATDEPKLNRLAIYAATGGVEFVIQAWLLSRRRRRTAADPVGA